MKDPITTPGRTYAVTSPNGCTVTTEDGLTLATVAAGAQGYFVAVSGKVLLNDEAAVLTQVFKLAPIALGGGGGSDVRPVVMQLVTKELTELLGDTSLFDVDTDGQAIIVHTDRLDGETLAAVEDMLARYVPRSIEVLRYNHNMEISWKDINKYAECTNTADMLAVNADYQNDVTINGEWVYPLPNATNLDSCFNEESSVRILKGTFPKLKRLLKFCHSKVLQEVELNIPTITGEGANYPIAHLFAKAASPRVKMYLPELKNAEQMIWDSPIEELEIYCPKLERASGAFYNTRLNKKSAIDLLDHIPPYTSGKHPLTIGIHIDHQNDDEVWVAISNAEAKWWTLTVQWTPGGPTYTTPDASTFAMGTLIYAKAVEMELPDGTMERYLDWGHYVTNWEERGYEQFRSPESAYRYFGLEMPAEPLINE